MAVLSETKRMVFVLYEVEGYSHAEMAQMLGVGESRANYTHPNKTIFTNPMEKANEF